MSGQFLERWKSRAHNRRRIWKTSLIGATFIAASAFINPWPWYLGWFVGFVAAGHVIGAEFGCSPKPSNPLRGRAMWLTFGLAMIFATFWPYSFFANELPFVIVVAMVAATPAFFAMNIGLLLGERIDLWLTKRTLKARRF
jgi:hypothetical protein